MVASKVVETVKKVTQFLTPSTSTKAAVAITAGVVAYKIFRPQKVSAKQRGMLGQKGTRISSKTMWQKGKTERIDIENPDVQSAINKELKYLGEDIKIFK